MEQAKCHEVPDFEKGDAQNSHRFGPPAMLTRLAKARASLNSFWSV